MSLRSQCLKCKIPLKGSRDIYCRECDYIVHCCGCHSTTMADDTRFQRWFIDNNGQTHYCRSCMEGRVVCIKCLNRSEDKCSLYEERWTKKGKFWVCGHCVIGV